MNWLVHLLGRGWRVLREEGLTAFLRSSRSYLHRVNVSTNGITVSYQTEARVDFEERWELIRAAIDPEDSSLLDIGCAEGHLTARFAERGIMSIGIERRAHTVASARKSNRDRPNIGFLQYEITPETVDFIPAVDVVLLLTVYHHWVAEYGWEAAENMLRSLETKCETLFFEMPNREVDRPPIPGDTGESIVEYYTTYLDMLFDDTATVEYLGTTDYRGDDRKDVLFAVYFEG